MSKALEDIAAERRRQISVEGWSAEHDDYEHRSGELAYAAACYALAGANKVNARIAANEKEEGEIWVVVKHWWQWSVDWWKPTDRRRNLVKAGALIVAEIERLDRRKS